MVEMYNACCWILHVSYFIIWACNKSFMHMYVDNFNVTDKVMIMFVLYNITGTVLHEAPGKLTKLHLGLLYQGFLACFVNLQLMVFPW